MTQANREAAAAAERSAAQAVLCEAVDLERLGHHGGAVSRAYYAAYHAARALLYEKAIEPRTHDGVRRMLGLHYVLMGEMAAADAESLAELAYMREASDYAPAQPITAAQAARAVALARAFLRIARVDVE